MDPAHMTYDEIEMQRSRHFVQALKVGMAWHGIARHSMDEAYVCRLFSYFFPLGKSVWQPYILGGNWTDRQEPAIQLNPSEMLEAAGATYLALHGPG